MSKTASAKAAVSSMASLGRTLTGTASKKSLVQVDHGVDLNPKFHQQAKLQRTPQQSSSIKPPQSAMHPHLNKQTNTTPHEESQWLGFFKMQPQTEPKQIGSKIHYVVPDSPTPMKAVNTIASSPARPPVPSASDFTFRRESSMGLSVEARKMMEETRAEAAVIRAKLAAEAAEKSQTEDVMGAMHSMRKIAHPKGRYSDAHKTAFNRMDSIANHASAWRSNSNRPISSSSPLKAPIPAKKVSSIGAPHLNTLKRSRSKTDLGTSSSNESSRDATPMKLTEQTPSNKRLKRKDFEEAVIADRNPAVMVDAPPSMPATPRGMLRSALYSPTKSSLARSKSVSSVRVSKIPALSRRQTIARRNSKTPVKNMESVAKLNSAFLSPTKASAQRLQEQLKILKPAAVLSLPKHTSVEGKDATPKTPNRQVSAIAATSNAPTPTPSRIHILPSARPLPQPPLNSPKPISSVLKIKSILRTPMRLYSSDPEKIAAGTHLATPPSLKFPATAPVVKHVDFSASARLKAARDEAKASSEEPEVTYPQLPASAPHHSQIHNVMYQHTTPGDFTFRAGNEIKFGPPMTSTIRAVRSSDESPKTRPIRPLALTKSVKRKFEASEDVSRYTIEEPDYDKENSLIQDTGRPAKRARAATLVPTQSASRIIASPAVKKPVKKPTAPSSSSRPAKRTGGMSVSRLNFLSQPKTR
jgi:hypothetical protein